MQNAATNVVNATSAAVNNIRKAKYKKVDTSLTKEQNENLGVHYMRKMSKNQFRECMGLLGLESNAFLSDRIFDVVD